MSTEYKDITTARRNLAFAVAEKSRLTIESAIKKKDEEIKALQEAVDEAESQAKEIITDIVGDNEGGINLIFHEVDFYLNYSKWGRLPIRIINALEDAGHESLQGVFDDLEKDEDILFDDPKTYLSALKGLSADDVELIIDSLAILSAPGERQLTELARGITNTIKNLIAGIAVLWIVVAGIRMILAGGDENAITEQKRAIIYGVIGLVAILLVDRGIDFIYGPAGEIRTELTEDVGFTAEVYGVITFIKAVIGTIAILFIVSSGVKMLFAAGEEQQITNQKRALLWIGLGLILIAIDEVIVKNVFIIPTQHSDQIRTSNITSLINTIGGIFQFILGFVGLIAFGALVYGAANMILNYGNDEMVERAKKIIKNALIGILIIISAYTIVATLVVFK